MKTNPAQDCRDSNVVASPSGKSIPRLPYFFLAVLLVVVAIFRSPILFDDRTWYDEEAVILQGHGISTVAWPSPFRRADVYLDPTFSAVLAAVRTGAYPPAMPATVFLFRGTTEPVRYLRSFLFTLGLALLVVAFLTAKSAGGAWFALLATTYVASSTVLTHASQQIKWISIAPPVSLIAAMLLLKPSASNRIRLTYVLALGVLLHIHYFCLWVVPGHLLYTLMLDRDHLSRQLKEIALALAAAAPWYLFALPTQLEFVREHFDDVAQMEVSAWNAPLSFMTGVRGLGYDLATGAGLLPLPLRGRYLTPLLLIVIWCLARAVTSQVPGRKRLGILAVTCAGSAAAAQVLYAVKVGNLVPLQPTYLSPWFPLLMIGILAGASEIGVRGIRVIVMCTLVAISLTAVAHAPLADKIAESGAPQDNEGLCRAVSALVRADLALVHQTDLEAKLFNIGCPIGVWQAVGIPGMERLPATARHALVVGGCELPFRALPDGWQLRNSNCEENTILAAWRHRSGGP